MIWKCWWIDDILVLIYLFVSVVCIYIGFEVIKEVVRRAYQVIFVRHYDWEEYKRMMGRKIEWVRGLFRKR